MESCEIGCHGLYFIDEADPPTPFRFKELCFLETGESDTCTINLRCFLPLRQALRAALPELTPLSDKSLVRLLFYLTMHPLEEENEVFERLDHLEEPHSLPSYPTAYKSATGQSGGPSSTSRTWRMQKFEDGVMTTKAMMERGKTPDHDVIVTACQDRRAAAHLREKASLVLAFHSGGAGAAAATDDTASSAAASGGGGGGDGDGAAQPIDGKKKKKKGKKGRTRR